MGLIRSAGRKAAVIPSGSAAVARASGLSPWRSGRPYSPDWAIKRAVRDGFQRSVWIYRGVHAIASAQAKLRVVARYGDPGNYAEGKEIPDHPIAMLLNSRPSPNEFSYSFRWRMHATLLLSARGVFIEKVPDFFGDPTQLTLLPPHLTMPIPNPQTFVSGYQVQMGEGSAEKVTVAPENVLWMRRPHPLDPYASMTPLEAAGLSIETDWLARLYQRNFLGNDGTPNLLVRVKGQMDEGDAEVLLQKLTGGGVSRAGRGAVVQADDIDAKLLSQGMKDMDYVAGRKALKEEQLGALGVPESIALANTAGRTFDNADADKYNFWTECMDDELSLVSQAVSTLDPDPDVVIGFDMSQIAVLERDRRARAVFFLSEVTANVRTINEYRPLSPAPMDEYVPPDFDEEPEPNPVTGDPGKPPVNPADVLRPGAAPPSITLTTLTTADGVNATPDATGEPKTSPSRRRGKTAAAERITVDQSIADAQRALVVDVMVRLYDRQAKVIAAKLAGPKARRGTWLYKPAGAKAVDVDTLWDAAVWDAQLRADAQPALLAAIDALGADVAAKAGASWTEPDAAIIGPLVDRMAATNGTTKAALAAAVAEQPGDTLDDVLGRVAELFEQAKDSRATTIATTELTAVASLAVIEAGTQAGGGFTQEWITGGNPRETHSNADGEKAALGGLFSIGESNLRYPGDPEGDAAEVVNCNCQLGLISTAGVEVEDFDQSL